VAADNDDKELFTFTCTSDYATVANELDILKSKLGTSLAVMPLTTTVLTAQSSPITGPLSKK
jgi:hypothetical protein